MKLSEIPLLKFDSDLQFHQELSKHAHDIHTRTLYLNDKDTILGCPPESWIDNLQMSLEYFIDIEEYEKCSEVKQLLDKLQS